MSLKIQQWLNDRFFKGNMQNAYAASLMSQGDLCLDGARILILCKSTELIKICDSVFCERVLNRGQPPVIYSNVKAAGANMLLLSRDKGV